MSYDTLATRIADQFPEGSESYDLMTMHRYGHLLGLILKVRDLAKINDTDEQVVPGWWANSTPDQGRLLAIASKMRIHELGNLIKRRLREHGIPATAVKTGFTHGRPLAEWFGPFDEHGEVGWQYQEGQWRLAMRFRSGPLYGRDRAQRSAREEFARAHSAWFAFAAFSGITGWADEPAPRSTESSDGFNHFIPDFIYRYRLLKEPTVEELLGLASDYSRAAQAFVP